MTTPCDNTPYKIWIVTQGCYSDYHIVGAFTSHSLAKIIASKIGGEAEEWDLDHHEQNQIADKNLYRVLINKKTGKLRRRISLSQVYNYDRKLTSCHDAQDEPTYLDIQCWARSPEHAYKIAVEQRQDWLKSLERTPEADKREPPAKGSNPRKRQGRELRPPIPAAGDRAICRNVPTRRHIQNTPQKRAAENKSGEILSRTHQPR